jgi:membrane fusion protein (multidrug efflux system)
MKEQAQTNLKQKRTRHILLYCCICLVLLTLFFLYWLFELKEYAYTNDAYVEGNMVTITPLRPGFIIKIHSDDTFLVKKGQILVDLDTTDDEISLHKAKEELAQTVRVVCQNFHQVFIYRAEIAISQAELIRVTQDYQHRQDVIQRGGVSVEDMEHAAAALDANKATLKRAHSLHEQALSFVQGTSIKNHPKVLAAADVLRDAFVQWKRCKIYAPVEGLVAQRTAQVGMWVNSGQPIMSVIPLDQIWVNANYKETQLKHMRIGQKAELTSDLYGSSIVYHGIIAGLPGAAGDAFSLLPPQNLTGNWIKIVQRVPVRIALDHDELQQHPLRIGLSMESTVALSDFEGDEGLLPTTTKAPKYETSVFEDEQAGVEEMITGIIDSNLDPKLEHYANNPLCLKNLQQNPLS